MIYHFKVHKDKTGYWAECVELEGCFTQANTKSQLQKNMTEALNTHLLEPVTSDFIFPVPLKKSRAGLIPVRVKPEIAFPLLLRNLRLNKKMKQHEFKTILGFENVYQYQRLEKIGSANPSLKMISHIKDKFPELKLEMIFD